MNHPAPETPERIPLPCVRFAGAPAVEWEEAMALLEKAMSRADVRLPAPGERLERRDAAKIMTALFELGGRAPRFGKEDARTVTFAAVNDQAPGDR